MAVPPKVVNGSDGWPIAIGSSTALLRELAAIKAKSPWALGTKPIGFDAPDGPTLTPAATVQWIWLALHDSASLAVEANAPLSIE
jgi:hypothetical protein